MEERFSSTYGSCYYYRTGVGNSTRATIPALATTDYLGQVCSASQQLQKPTDTHEIKLETISKPTGQYPPPPPTPVNDVWIIDSVMLNPSDHMHIFFLTVCLIIYALCYS